MERLDLKANLDLLAILGCLGLVALLENKDLKVLREILAVRVNLVNLDYQEIPEKTVKRVNLENQEFLEKTVHQDLQEKQDQKELWVCRERWVQRAWRDPTEHQVNQDQ